MGPPCLLVLVHLRDHTAEVVAVSGHVYTVAEAAEEARLVLVSHAICVA
jgi:hypothetical protein